MDLDKIDIAKGCFVIDVHWEKTKRLMYFLRNKVDIIFSVTKSPFLTNFPQFKQRFCWTPFAINQDIIKDWNETKEIKFLLMGLVYDGTSAHPPKGRYPFREAVLRKMNQVEGFHYHPHPGHLTTRARMVNETYAKELNRAEIFFTCGGVFQYPVIKFFEALGCRTLLLAQPNPDILELGFQEGKHFVACHSENFFEKAMYYSKNREERERIMDNGYRFVQTNHTNDIRAQQMLSSIEQLLQEKKSL